MSSWAGSLIRLARHDAGISQKQLADLVAMPEPRLAAYESGEESLTLDELARIVRAAGRDLRIHVVPYDDHDDVMRRWEASLPEDVRDRLQHEREDLRDQARMERGLPPIGQADPGEGVDRTVIRRLLELTPSERLALATEEANNLKRLGEKRGHNK